MADGVNLLHYRLVDARLLKARFSATPHGPRLRRTVRRRSALSQQRPRAENNQHRVEDFFRHDPDLQATQPDKRVDVVWLTL